MEGSTLLDPEAVRKTISAYEKKSGSIPYFNGLAEKLTSLYREKGYVTSYVYLPPQKIEGGVLMLKAVEGRVGNLEIEEGQYFKKQALSARISLDKDEPFNANVLERNLRLINQNPDMRVQASLKAGDVPGQTDLQLKIADQLPFHISGFGDNLGRRLVGENRLGVTGNNNNVLGFGDSLLSSSSFSRSSYSLVNHYEIPLGSHGTTVSFDHAYSRSILGKELKELDIVGRASIYSPTVTQVVIDRKNVQAKTDVGFDWIQLETNLQGENLNRDQLRVLKTGLSLDLYDKFGATQMRHEVGIGLDLMGATTGAEPNVSRAGAGSKFFRYTGSLSRMQKLPHASYGIFRATGQFSPDRLVSAQQFQEGGAFTVRGYKEGLLIGDQGFVLSGEIRTPFFLAPKSFKLPFSNYGVRDNIQFVSFVDFGASYTNKPDPGIGKSEYIMGIGVGLRVQLTKSLTGRIDLGIPLLRQHPENLAPRIHFGVQNAFL